MDPVSLCDKIDALAERFEMVGGTLHGHRLKNEGVLHELAHLVTLGKRVEDVLQRADGMWLGDVVSKAIETHERQGNSTDQDEARAIAATLVILEEMGLLDNRDQYVQACMMNAQFLTKTWWRIEALVAEEIKLESAKQNATKLCQMVLNLHAAA